MPRSRATRPLALLCGAALAACSGDTTSATPNRIVTYRLETTGCMNMDSVKYNSASNTMIKVTNPASGWLTTLSVSGAGTMSASAWGAACGGPASAKLKATWTTPGYTSESDSSIVSVGTPAPITLAIPPRAI